MRRLPTFLLLILTSITAESASIHINGIPEDKKTELLAKLSHRLDFIKSRKPSPWRADDAAYFFKRLLIRIGHMDAEVDWALPGGDIIEINAKAGPRYLYGKVSANQLEPLSIEELNGYFFQPLVSTESVAAENAPYIEEYSDQDAVNVRNYLHSKGYWHAEVAVARETIDRKSQRVAVKLQLSHGPLFSLAQPTIRGVPSQDTQSILAETRDLLGKDANTANIIKIRSIVENYFRKRGYHYAKIQVTAEHRGNKTHIIFNINRGQIFTVGKVIVKGAEKTKNRRIRRYFNGLKDKQFDQHTADIALNELLTTGAFMSAALNPVITGARAAAI